MIKYEDINVGDFVKDKYDWFLVNYKYLDGKIISCSGLGKMGDFPILIEELTSHHVTKQYDTALSYFHENNHMVWVDKTKTHFLYTFPSKSYDGDLEKNVYQGVEIYKDLFGSGYVKRHIGYISYDYQLGNYDRLLKWEPSTHPDVKDGDVVDMIKYIDLVTLDYDNSSGIIFNKKLDHDIVGTQPGDVRSLKLK